MMYFRREISLYQTDCYQDVSAIKC